MRRGSVDTSTPAVVLDAGYGGLGIARSLGRLGVPVFGTLARGDSPVARSRYWKATFEWDFAASAAGRSVGFLIEVGRRVGRQAVLIPTSDITAAFVAGQASVLAGRFIFPRQLPEMVQSLIDKRKMYALAASRDVPVPLTCCPGSRVEVEQFLSGADFPILIKGAHPAQPGATAKVVCRSAEEVLQYYDAAGDGERSNLVLQEYVPGDEDAGWMVNGYFDDRCRPLGVFTGRKMRQYPPYAGVASLGVWVSNTRLAADATRFLQGIGYRGPFDMDYRRDARDGCYRLLDVNPRIGAAFRLFVDRRGMDVARALYLDQTGQPVTSVAPSDGRRWLLEEDLLACMRYRRDGRLTLASWVRSLVGVREAVWFAADDPKPLLARCVHGLRQAVPRRVRPRDGTVLTRPGGAQAP